MRRLVRKTWVWLVRGIVIEVASVVSRIEIMLYGGFAGIKKTREECHGRQWRAELGRFRWLAGAASPRHIRGFLLLGACRYRGGAMVFCAAYDVLFIYIAKRVPSSAFWDTLRIARPPAEAARGTYPRAKVLEHWPH